jgi:hypothetical protein
MLVLEKLTDSLHCVIDESLKLEQSREVSYKTIPSETKVVNLSNDSLAVGEVLGDRATGTKRMEPYHKSTILIEFGGKGLEIMLIYERMPRSLPR